jgi:DNA-binding NarL/FixJ family response regulator
MCPPSDRGLWTCRRRGLLSEKTVSRHRSNVLTKLGLTDRVGITRYAIRNGLVDP